MAGGQRQLGADAQNRDVPAPARPRVEVEERRGAGAGNWVGCVVLGALQVRVRELDQAVAARLGPRGRAARAISSPSAAAALIGRGEIVELEMDAADQVRHPHEPELVVRPLRVAAHLAVPAQCLLVAPAREVGVAEMKERLPEDAPGVRLLGEGGSFLEVGQAAVEIGPPLHDRAEEDQGARAQRRILHLLGELERGPRGAPGVRNRPVPPRDE